MSIAIINATVGGTLTVSGATTLSSPLISNSRADFQGNVVISGNAIINSNCNVAGNINLTTFGLVAGATTITNAQLGYLSGATSNIQTQLGTVGTTATTALKGATNTWTGVNTFNNNVILPTATYLSDAGLFLRSSGDGNHKLQYNATSDGPALQGLGGGRLGIAGNPTILTWNSTTIDMNLRTSFNNEIRLNANPLYIKSVGDNNHLLQYVGAPYDGVALQGGSGGKIGTVAKTDMINWTSSAGINTVNVSANTNLTGNVNILPYTTNTTLSAYQLNCQAITCLGQVVASGVGLLTTKLQCSANGTGILGLQCGSYTASTNANQTVSFPNTFLGSNNPIVFLQPVYASATTGTAYVISTSLTSFTYRFFFDGSVNSESGILMYWQAYQI